MDFSSRMDHVFLPTRRLRSFSHNSSMNPDTPRFLPAVTLRIQFKRCGSMQMLVKTLLATVGPIGPNISNVNNAFPLRA